MINLQIEDLIVDVYEVYTTTTDGQKKDLVGVFLSYSSAYEAAKGKGAWGTSGLILGAKGFVIENKAFVLKYEPVKISIDLQTEKEKEIEEILNKLTPEEIEKLNIKKDDLKKQFQPVESEPLPFNIPA